MFSVAALALWISPKLRLLPQGDAQAITICLYRKLSADEEPDQEADSDKYDKYHSYSPKCPSFR